jgi:hypothetical protein
VSKDDDTQFLVHLLEKYPKVVGKLTVSFEAPGTCNVKVMVNVVC